MTLPDYSPQPHKVSPGIDRAKRLQEVRFGDYRRISLNNTPPFAFAVGSDSTISTVTASTGTEKFFTTASVMSFTSARFWSSVRPLTAWTYISGISISLDVLDAAL